MGSVVANTTMPGWPSTPMKSSGTAAPWILSSGLNATNKQSTNEDKLLWSEEVDRSCLSLEEIPQKSHDDWWSNKPATSCYQPPLAPPVGVVRQNKEKKSSGTAAQKGAGMQPQQNSKLQQDQPITFEGENDEIKKHNEKRRSKRAKKRRIAMMKSSRRKRRQAAAKRRKLLRNAAQLNSNVARKEKIRKQIDEKYMLKKREAEKKVKMEAAREATVERDAELDIAEISHIDMIKVIETIAILEDDEGQAAHARKSEMSWEHLNGPFNEICNATHNEELKVLTQKCLTKRKEADEKNMEQQISVQENDILLSVRTSDDMGKDILENLEKLMEKYKSKKETNSTCYLTNDELSSEDKIEDIKEDEIEGEIYVSDNEDIEPELQTTQENTVHNSETEKAIVKQIFEEILDAALNDELSSEEEMQDISVDGTEDEIYVSDDEDTEPELQTKQIFEEILVQVEDIGSDLSCSMGMQRGEEKAEYITGLFPLTERGEATSNERVVQLLGLDKGTKTSSSFTNACDKEPYQPQEEDETCLPHNQPLQPETTNDKLQTVIGGNPNVMLFEVHNVEVHNDILGREATARARVEDVQSLRGHQESFDVIERAPVSDLENFNKNQQNIEKKVNQEKIELIADPLPHGDLTTPANFAANDRNFRQMQHCPEGIRTAPIEQRTEQRTNPLLESLSQIFTQRSNRSPEIERHRHRGQRKEEPRFAESLFSPMFGNTWFETPKININVHKKPEDGVYLKEVQAEPFCSAMGIPREDCYNAGRLKLIEKHHVALSKKSGKARRKFYMEIVKEDLLQGNVNNDARILQKEAEKLSPEGVNIYRKQLQSVDSSLFEQGSEFQAKVSQDQSQQEQEEEKISKADILKPFEDFISWYHQQDSVEITKTVKQEMAILEGINFMEDALGITLTRPPFTVETDGDCLLNATAMDTSINRTIRQNAEHGTDLRQIIFTEAIEKVKTMAFEKMQLLQGAGGAFSREHLVHLLEIYSENGQWSGNLGDLMPQIVSSFINTPLFVIAINPDNNQTRGYFVNPSHLFDMDEHNSVPIVLVRQDNHYNRLLVPEQAEDALTLIYKQAEPGELGISLPYSRSAHLVSEGRSRKALTMDSLSRALRSVGVEPGSDSAAPAGDPVFVKHFNNPPKTVEEEEEEANHDIFNNLQCISLSGPNWRRAIRDSLLGAHPNYKLKIGVNISCTIAKPGDMLCSVHSVVTALLNLESIKYNASLKRGPVGNALTKFTESGVETEKSALIDILAEECGSNEDMGKCGQDAGVSMRTLLEKLQSEGPAGTNIFSQDLEVFSTCISCKGGRKSCRTEVMSVKYNNNIADEKEPKEVCKNEENCADGVIYKTQLMNCPDTIVQVVGSRGGSVTYKQKEHVPLEIRNTVEGLKYNLKFCIVHLGKSPLAGHFVTLLSNPVDREECVIVDNGEVKWINQKQFEEFSNQAYIIGYEMDDPKTIPQQFPAEILSKMGEALKKTVRREHALKSQTFLGELSKNIEACHYAIDKSFTPTDAKKAFIHLIRQRTYRKKNFPLLMEEEEANRRAFIVFEEIKDYKPKSWSIIKKIRSFLGLYDESISRNLRCIEMMCNRVNIKEPVPKSQVFGTGVEPWKNNKNTFRQNADFTNLLDDNGKPIFKCCHCGTLGCKEDIIMHHKKGRCSVLTSIDKHYRITPRNIASGVWWNENVRVRVIRRHDRGNKTKILVENKTGNVLSCVYQTISPSDLDDSRNLGKETDEGKAWDGQGYCLNESILAAIRETVKFKDQIGQETNNFPVWSLLGQVFSITNSREDKTGVILNVESHPAKNPANRKLEKEFELILVASEDGGQDNFKLVFRQTGKQDEELTYFKRLNYSEEEPFANDRILESLINCGLHLYVTKAQLAEVKQFSDKGYKINRMLKFINPGDNICWGNVATQLLLHTRPDIGRDLFQTMEQPSELSGARDLPRMILEIITKATEQQSLNELRYLLAPQRQGAPGPALDFFEKLVEKLKIQSPTAIDGFAVEHELYELASQCSTKGCNGTMPPSSKIRRRDLLLLYHRERLDGTSAQHSINRLINELEKPFSRICTQGHSTMVKKMITSTKMPEVFLVNALDASLDQTSSLEVQLSGVKYRATGIWHHIQGRVGHHYCSLYDAKTNQWFKIDDYHSEKEWKKPYHFDRKESVFKCGHNKLFDNLGVVFYERYEREDIIDGPEMDEEVIKSNFHTRTKSGQQVFLSRNMLNECYAIQAVAFLLSNPYMHHLLRTWPQANCNQLENYLRTVCHNSPTTIAPNTQVLRNLVPQLQNFRSNQQQDSMEFLTSLLQSIRLLDEVNAEGHLVHKAPVSTEVLGFTFVTNTRCMLPDCTRNNEGRSREFVFSIEVSGSSLNECLRLQFETPQYISPAKCDTCHSEYAQYERIQHVVDLKKCVIIQLKRFSTNGKLTDHVTADEILQTGSFRGYELTGVILHHGDTIQCGHYTHILRDVENHTWIETNNHKSRSLGGDDARAQIGKMGYIFFYASPNTFPEALKSNRQAHTEHTSGSKNRKEKKQRKTFFTQTSKFRTNDDPMMEQIDLPKMHQTSKMKKLQICTPTEQQISARIEENVGNQTKERIIERNNPLYDVLKGRFGHDDFLCPEQLTATREVIAGNKDVLVLFPTGMISNVSSFYFSRRLKIPHLPNVIVSSFY